MNKLSAASRSVSFLLLAVFSFGLSSVGAADSPPVKVQRAPAQETLFSDLIAQAEQSGSARVIVGFNAAFTPEGSLSSGEAQQQQEDIAQALVNLVSSMAAYDIDWHQASLGWSIPFVAMSADANALRALQGNPAVTYIQEDVMNYPSLATSVPHIGAPTVWNDGNIRGQNTTVAVLDTGTHLAHEFFPGGTIVAEACYSQNSQGTQSNCPNGQNSQTGPGSSQDCSGAEGCGHGTHVAGIVLGRTNNQNFSGVAPEANLISVNVFMTNTKDNSVSGFTSDILSGLQFVYDLRNTHTIAAANLSLGSDHPGGAQATGHCDAEEAATKAMFDQLRAANIAPVVATGNESRTTQVGSPACVSSAVAVGSTGNSTDTVSDFSNSAPEVDLLAPGGNINSAQNGTTNGYVVFSGTSMATPTVAGAWALIRQAAPAATIDQIEQAFKDSGVAVLDSRNNITKPRINVPAARQALAGATDVIFANGFDGNAVPNDLVTINDINFVPAADFTGGSIRWSDGSTCACDDGPYDLNVYGTAAPTFFWLNGSSGVSTNDTTYAVLGSGDTVGPGSNYITADTTAATAPWHNPGNVDGFLGFQFTDGIVKYGYARITTGTNGRPFTIVSITYNNVGAAVTIP